VRRGEEKTYPDALVKLYLLYIKLLGIEGV
jgi:hypothetical protein